MTDTMITEADLARALAAVRDEIAELHELAADRGRDDATAPIGAAYCPSWCGQIREQDDHDPTYHSSRTWQPAPRAFVELHEAREGLGERTVHIFRDDEEVLSMSPAEARSYAAALIAAADLAEGRL